MVKYGILLNESPWIKYLLSLLGVANGTIISSIRIHKEMFLISRGIPELLEEDLYGPHDYGPYSEDVDDDIIGLLEVEGLLRVTRKEESSTVYELTNDGKVAAKEAMGMLDKGALDAIKRVHELVSDLTSDEILFLIYFMYPKMAKYSKVYQEIVKNKLKLAASIYKKNKMSIKQLAELAGVDEKDLLSV